MHVARNQQPHIDERHTTVARVSRIALYHVRSATAGGLALLVEAERVFRHRNQVLTLSPFLVGRGKTIGAKSTGQQKG
jgi:ABC-type transporter Mla MlaB component